MFLLWNSFLTHVTTIKEPPIHHSHTDAVENDVHVVIFGRPMADSVHRD